jgi:hypothetical protein
MFSGRKLLIATKHDKEKVIAPVFETELGVTCVLPEGFDTDELGTFCGEIERKYDPITTARNKCLLAMESGNYDLAIASEGSFGPHPSLFFVPADQEFLIFIDKKNGLEISVSELSTDTNFDAREVNNQAELDAFAKSVNFPSHGIIIKDTRDNFTELRKGIINQNELLSTFEHFILKYGKAYVETDMRALYNPTRMHVIQKACLKLINKIKSACPACSSPGFGVTDARKGLPCDLCGFPTRSTLSYIYTCQKCHFEREEKYPNGKQTEDAAHCDLCNP